MTNDVGELYLIRLDEGRSVYIQEAAPRIWITASLMHLLEPSGPFHEVKDGCLKIYGVNRTVIYRIGRKVPTMYCYEAEWPD